MRADNLFDEILEIADSIKFWETITIKAGKKEITQADRFQYRSSFFRVLHTLSTSKRSAAKSAGTTKKDWV